MSTVSTLISSAVIPVQFFLTQSGDGLGTFNHIGNYSAANTDMHYLATTPFDIHTILINITDTPNFTHNDYGSLTVGTIVNGVKLIYYNKAANYERELLSGYAFTQNHQWLQITPDVKLTTFAGNVQSLVITFDMVREYGTPFTLAIGDKFIVRLHDNFTGLIDHTFGIRGTRVIS